MLQGSGDFGHDAAVVLVSAIGSVVATVAVFRARLAVMDSRHDALAKQIERDRVADAALLEEKLDRVNQSVERHAKDSRARFDIQERLQRAVLTMVATIASKEGADQRQHTTDVLTRFMAEESKE